MLKDGKIDINKVWLINNRHKNCYLDIIKHFLLSKNRFFSRYFFENKY